MGIETLGEVFTKIIERNTTIPTSRTQVFSTAIDGQTSVEVHALQGERAMARDNKSLGRFELAGIPPAPRGVPQIEVSFEIDADGILQVAAKDRGTNREQSIKITNRGGLSSAEIARMKEDAEMYAGEDEQRKMLAELQNKADSLFYSYESTMRDSGSHVSEELKAQSEAEAEALRSALADRNANSADITQKLDALRQTIFNIGAGLYRQTGNENSGSRTNREMPGVKRSAVPAPADRATPTPDYSSRDQSTFAADVHATDQTASDTATAITYRTAEEEFDIDSTVAADYEAIE